MDSKILELKKLRNNVDYQCIPTTLSVVLQNQFKEDKRTQAAKIPFSSIKKWSGWGDKKRKTLVKMIHPRKDKNIINEIFKGSFNTETFHQELNNHLQRFNLKLMKKTGFQSRDINGLINKGKFPMFLINPSYINERLVNYNNPKTLNIRSGGEDMSHFIAAHGIDKEFVHLYDCDLFHSPKEILSEKNIRCSVPLPLFKTFAKDTIYWFELNDKSSATKLSPYQK